MVAQNKKENILIIGGGFSGIKAAQTLAKYSKYFNITLVSDSDNFRYYPTLFHLATGGDNKFSSIPLSEIFNNTSVKVIIGTADILDRNNKSITLTDKTVLGYDKLLLGLGVITNYFDIEGLEQYSYSIKTEARAKEFNKFLHDYIKNNKAPDSNYVVVGGGPTGIELAAQLPSYIRHLLQTHDIHHKAIHVELIEALPKLLPRLPKDYSKIISHRLNNLGVSLRLASAVTAQTNDSIIINNETVFSKTVIWTAGVTNHPFYNTNNFSMTKHNKVSVDIYLQAEDSIYVMGDNANTPNSGLAQTALHDGYFISKNLIRIAKNETPLSYKPKKIITIIPVGKHWAAVLVNKIKLYGLTGAALRHMADIEGYHSVLSWRQTIKLLLPNFKKMSGKCPYCDETINNS